MSTHFILSRRRLLLTGGGLAVTSLLPVSHAAAQAPVREGELNLLTTDPRNGGPDLEQLIESWITPTSRFFVRSHGPNPQIDVGDFQLRVEGLVRRPTSFRLAEVLAMPSRTITATLTCAGNRRVEFNPEREVGGVQWDASAIGNANWTGVPLASLLQQVELLDQARHVWFEGLDQIASEGEVTPFGGSIPIEQALRADPQSGTILAHQMNGAPLTPDHGYPLRSIVPGYIGARSVKWLGKIVVSDRPSPNHYVEAAYKMVRQTEAIDWTESAPIYRYPINGAIATPRAHATVEAGMVEAAGYVLPSGRGGARITEVLVSADEGATWTAASLTGNDADYCWQLWRASLRVSADTKHILLRAEDSTGDFMPERIPWNAKGYLQNSWYRQPIRVG
jgi:sulfite oxidase